ncbi:MAG: hypothetical protein OXH83_08670 [Bryobacterales bacterium]|nr:hypothetical protein [Bryobacterales bacterium]
MAGISLVEGGERMGTGQGAAGTDGEKRQISGGSDGLTHWLKIDDLRDPSERFS